MKVLYVEDDPAARQYVERGLRRHGFVVDVATTAAEGHERALSGEHDVWIIDVVLPDRPGTELLRDLRAGGSEIPALFLSERGEVEARLSGFAHGADDYLPKPFALSELLARLRALARRRLGEPMDGVLRVADLELDVGGRSVVRGGRRIDLPPKQYALLELLLRNAGRVLSRQTLLEKAWGHDADLRSNAVDVQINYLRKQVDAPFAQRLIHTRPRVGYVLEDRSAAERSGAAPEGAARVLVVDDSAANRVIATRLLARAGYETEAVADGPAAVDAARRGGFDVILMDLMLPGMDGGEAAAEIRALEPGGARVAVVAMTATPLGELGGAAGSDFDDYLGKPLDRDALLAVVGRWVRERRGEAPEAVLDPEALRRIERDLGGDAAEVVDAFAREIENQLLALPDALSSGSLEAATRCAHGIKANAGALGARALERAAVDLEAALLAGDAAEAAERARALDPLAGDLRKALAER